MLFRSLTLLFADGPGLEVKLREQNGEEDGGTWLPIQAPPGALIVNIGDLLATVSGERWKSTPHRVPAPAIHSPDNADRLALVCFIILAADFPLDDSGMTQGLYLRNHFKRWGRNAKTQGDTGEEGQEKGKG